MYTPVMAGEICRNCDLFSLMSEFSISDHGIATGAIGFRNCSRRSEDTTPADMSCEVPDEFEPKPDTVSGGCRQKP